MVPNSCLLISFPGSSSKLQKAGEEHRYKAIACREQLKKGRSFVFNLQALAISSHTMLIRPLLCNIPNQWLTLREIKFLLQMWTKHIVNYCEAACIDTLHVPCCLWWPLVQIWGYLWSQTSAGKPAVFAASSCMQSVHVTSPVTSL